MGSDIWGKMKILFFEKISKNLSNLKNFNWPLDLACPEMHKKQVFGKKLTPRGAYFKKKQLFVFFGAFFSFKKKHCFCFFLKKTSAMPGRHTGLWAQGGPEGGGVKTQLSFTLALKR